MFKHPTVFVVQKLSIEPMYQDIDVADWMKMFERKLNNLDATDSLFWGNVRLITASFVEAPQFG